MPVVVTELSSAKKAFAEAYETCERNGYAEVYDSPIDIECEMQRLMARHTWLETRLQDMRLKKSNMEELDDLTTFSKEELGIVRVQPEALQLTEAVKRSMIKASSVDNNSWEYLKLKRINQNEIAGLKTAFINSISTEKNQQEKNQHWKEIQRSAWDQVVNELSGKNKTDAEKGRNRFPKKTSANARPKLVNEFFIPVLRQKVAEVAESSNHDKE